MMKYRLSLVAAMSNRKKEFEKFYKTNIDKVYRFVFFRCQNRELAEDLVSEIFIKALNHFDDYNEEISKTAWLMTIAKNHLANYWRDRKITIPIDAPDAEGDTESDARWLKSAVSAFQKEKSKNMAYELLSKLKPEEAEIVTLHYLVGYSYSEIAAIKNSSEGAIKVASHRIIKKMQSLI